jgi:hypothetical protein
MRRRAVMALLVAVALAWVGALPAGAQDAGGPWAGTWETDWGTWTLEQSGDRVFGTYQPDAGRIFGMAAGDTLSGSWAKAPSYAPPDDAGDLELTLDPDGTTFSGRLRYGSSGDWLDVSGVLTGAGPAETPAVAGEPLVLSRVELPSDLRTGRLNAVIAGGSGFMAVGSRGAYDRPVALVVTSGDGYDWTSVALTGTAAGGDIVDITAWAGGYAAIGRARSGDAAQVWLSQDGEAWEVVGGGAFAGTRPVAILELGDGLLGVGCRVRDGECTGSVAWTSPDGRTWRRATLDLDPTWELTDGMARPSWRSPMTERPGPHRRSSTRPSSRLPRRRPTGWRSRPAGASRTRATPGSSWFPRTAA